MAHTRIIRVSAGEAKRRNMRVLTKACALGCYFCDNPHSSPCCHGTCCNAPESARVKDVANEVAKQIASGKVKIKVGVDGKVTLDGLADTTLHDLSTDQVVNHLKLYGTPQAKMALQRAEQLSGRKIVTN